MVRLEIPAADAPCWGSRPIRHKELRAMADSLNYDIDWEVLSQMIDALCDMAHEVNVEG